MKHVVQRLMVAGLSLIICGNAALVSFPEDRITHVAYCDLARHPERYSGKIISVRADAVKWKNGTTISVGECVVSKTFLSLPGPVRPKVGFKLHIDSSLKKFFEGLDSPAIVEATFEGRFDSNYSIQNGKKVRLTKGFGPKKKYSMRLVLRRITDVVVIPLFRK